MGNFPLPSEFRLPECRGRFLNRFRAFFKFCFIIFLDPSEPELLQEEDDVEDEDADDAPGLDSPEEFNGGVRISS